MIRSAKNLVKSLVDVVRQRRTSFEAALTDVHSPIGRCYAWQSNPPFELSRREFAEAIAQSVTCAQVIANWVEFSSPLSSLDDLTQRANPLIRAFTTDSDASRELGESVILGTTANDIFSDSAWEISLRDIDWDAVSEEFHDRYGFSDPMIGLYEAFLAEYDHDTRRRKGVFFTPRPVARFIVRSVDEFLRREFDLPHGLADTSTWSEMKRRGHDLTIQDDTHAKLPFVQVLDPAAGTGTFLIETIDLVNETMTAKWRCDGFGPDEVTRLWNEYVARHLLPRLYSCELLPAPWALSHVIVALKLCQTGYRMDQIPDLNLFCCNPLHGPGHVDGWLTKGCGGQRRQSSSHWPLIPPPTVLLGNPPFSGISNNQNAWINGLLKGRTANGEDVQSYYEVDGHPLRERKVWLQDDYVKFVRFAHWAIECTGCGVVGYVTNHGYLANPTFRGMRQSLMRTFSRISVIDLHGNIKKNERQENGRPDENVFPIEQGVAVGVFRRVPADQNARIQGALHVDHGGLWGDRRGKFRRLDESSAATIASVPIEPSSPNYFFHPFDERLRAEYERGYRLPDVMPLNSTAVVTARDGFVVALEPDKLLERFRQFRDLTIGDDEIRDRFFRNGRSRRYPAGDTRGWRLDVARRRVADEVGWQENIRSCLYRPFDRRSIYWAEWMVDWPRPEISSYLLSRDNLALVARRQMLPGHPCNFFWISDDITIDGIIRSDNRGSESLFPLYAGRHDKINAEDERPANFSSNFTREVERTTELCWIPRGQGDLRSTVGPEDVLHYIYALFYSPTYRARYADQLRTDFPRVFVAGHKSLWRTMCRIGRRLVMLHLMTAEAGTLTIFKMRGDVPPLIASRYPRYAGDCIYVNDHCWFTHVSEEVWEFRVGAHQVCRKWLKDRRGCELTECDIRHYCSMLAAIEETLQMMVKLDRAIHHHGGFPLAFASI